MDLDAAAVTAVLAEGPDALGKVGRLRLGQNYLKGPARNAWRLVEAHHAQFGRLPTADLLIQQVVDLKLPHREEVESLDFYVQELRYRDRQEKWERLGPEVGEFVRSKKFDDAEKRMKEFLNRAEDDRHIEKPFIVNLFEATADVKARYLDAEAGKIGVPYPWPLMNELTMGAEPGDLNGIVARLGQGKTQTSILCCHHAWKMANKKCVFISPEMKRVQIAQRLFARDLMLSHSKMRRGRLEPIIRDKFFDELERINKLSGIWVISDEFRISLANVETAIQLAEPDIVYIDGVYLVLAARGLSRQENAEQLADGLKDLAKRYGVPINYTSQFNRTVSKNDPSSVTDAAIALSDSWGWNSSNIFAMIQTEDMKASREMRFKVIKARDDEGQGEVLVRWDWSSQTFEQLDDDRKAYRDVDYEKMAAGNQEEIAVGETGPLPF